MSNYPYVISSPYSLPEANTPIELFRGKMKVWSDSHKIEGEGNISIGWHPRPQLAFTVSETDLIQFRGHKVKVAFEDVELRALYERTTVTHVNNQAISIGHGKLETTSLINPEDEGNLTSIIFHVINLPTKYLGEAISNGKSIWLGRIILSDPQWKITLDARDYEQEERLEASGGYSVTHLGKVVRQDRSRFSTSEALELLSMLKYVFSFARGFWSPVVIPVGFNELELADMSRHPL